MIIHAWWRGAKQKVKPVTGGRIASPQVAQLNRPPTRSLEQEWFPTNSGEGARTLVIIHFGQCREPSCL